MAWYRTGTITVTNGSTAASGTLTAWLSNVRAGDFLFVGTAAPVEVASVASNTSLTLAAAWPGASQTSVAYAIAPGSAWGDVTALSVQIAQLIANQTDILSGSGVPSNSLGADGSVYFRLDAPEYYAKTGGSWGTAISLTGPAGPAGPGVSATSTTSNTIGTGAKTFTVGSGASAFLGARMRAARTAAPTNYLEGIVTAVTSTTITITATATGGSGTFTDWSITLAGEPGSQGPAGSPSIGTSTSSVAIGTGSKTFTVPASLDLIAGQRVRFADAAAPATNWMEGIITAYSSTTMVINVAADGASTAGSGTFSNWTFGIIGSRGLQGPQGDVGPAGAASTVPGPSYAATSTSSVAIGYGDKDFTTQAGLAYVVNASRARAADTANPANFVEGLVTVYSGTSMRIAVDRIGGSGTITSWNISLAGEPGKSLVFRGAYSGATAYFVDDVVTNQNSCWVCLVDTTGNAPPTLPTTSNTQWAALAVAGTNGTGLVDSVNNIAPVTGNVTIDADDLEMPGTAVNIAPANTRITGWLEALDSAVKSPTTQIFTASGTWTKPAGCVAVSVTAVGGGGGGGTPTAVASQIGLGGSGGGGGTAYAAVDVTAISTVTVTVGAGGTGGASAGTNGGNGGTSSFGTHCSATGGTGGSTLAAGTTVGRVLGGSGGSGATGDLLVSGGAAGLSVRIDGSSSGGYSAEGGSSTLGGGGRGASSNDGSTGGNYGGGGSGAVSNSATVRFGGSGAGGIVIVTEYYS